METLNQVIDDWELAFERVAAKLRPSGTTTSDPADAGRIALRLVELAASSRDAGVTSDVPKRYEFHRS